MTATEDLLRATLADDRRRLEATADLRLGAHQRAGQHRRRRTAVRGTAGLAVAALAVGASVLFRPTETAGPPVGPPTGSSLSAGPQPAVTTLPESGTAEVPAVGPPIDFTMAERNSWLLTAGNPGSLAELHPVTGEVRNKVAVRGDTDGAGIAVDVAVDGDPDADVVWVWTVTTSPETTSTLRRYDARTLAHLGSDVTRPFAVTALVAEHGRLWISNGSNLELMTGPEATPVVVPGTDGAYALALDRKRGRVLVDLEARQIVALDPDTRKVVVSAPSSLGKASIAWTADDHLWTAGYGDGPDKVVRRDPETLKALPAPELPDPGPGAIVWPGHSVVWVRNGGDLGLSCLDAATGEVVGRWQGIQGSVSSVPGLAYGVTDVELRRILLPPGCPG
jgi:hypothetical protein